MDDEPLVRQALHRLLRKEPYEVFIAEGPAEALQYMQEYDVGLVVSDQRMPEMSGVEFLRNVRKISPSTKGIILTAYPESVFEETAPGDPPPSLLSKPWDDETLRGTILELLESGNVGRKPAAPSSREPELEFSRILVPLDGTQESETALAAVMPLVRSRAGSRIGLVHVIQDAGAQSTASEYMARSRQALAAQRLESVFWVQMGDPAKEILECASASGSTLIAMASHGSRNLHSFLWGSVTERVLRGAVTPVLACRPGMNFGSWKHFLVPLDGSKESEAVLPVAAALAKQVGASLVLARVATPQLYGGFATGETWLDVRDGLNPLPYLQGLADPLRLQGVKVAVVGLFGAPVYEICRYSESAHIDLVCMATHGRRGMERLLSGSVTENILPRSPCPVLVSRIVPTP